ncbi:MAG: DinB family protein [Thermoplasmata archaeon]
MADAGAAYFQDFSQIPSERLVVDRAASYPSILDIFAHALLAHQNWILYAYRDGDEPPSKATGWTLTETEALAGRVKEILWKFLTSLRPADLHQESTFHWTPGDESTRVPMKVRDMLWHLVEEELPHRGEINALLWQ